MSPERTVYVVAWAVCSLNGRSCGVCPTRPRTSVTIVRWEVALGVTGLAIAGGEMTTAAATPASTGAAATDSRREIR
jgi:hypothetical protein